MVIMEDSTFKSGFAAIIGAPNVGKSTLLNNILEEKLAIVSPKPQTTRNRILGVYHGKNFQIAFMDTPGIHRTKTMLHKSMVASAVETVSEVDILIFVIDITHPFDEEAESVLKQQKKRKIPAVLAINKIDRTTPDKILPVIKHYSGLFPFKAIVPVSALSGDGVERLIDELKKCLSPGPEYFPGDMTTDQPEEFLAAEIIREKIYLNTKREIPYSSAVTITSMKENTQKKLLSIHAKIHVETDSQKGIIIGKRGAMIKKIGEAARIELEKLYGIHVFLELQVKVDKNWSRNTKALQKLGY
ncbi:MAG: GTPase Era [Desulfobacteraceae bacterium]|jgi:GTP-binding protein Era